MPEALLPPGARFQRQGKPSPYSWVASTAPDKALSFDEDEREAALAAIDPKAELRTDKEREDAKQELSRKAIIHTASEAVEVQDREAIDRMRVESGDPSPDAASFGAYLTLQQEDADGYPMKVLTLDQWKELDRKDRRTMLERELTGRRERLSTIAASERSDNPLVRAGDVLVEGVTELGSVTHAQAALDVIKAGFPEIEGERLTPGDAARQMRESLSKLPPREQDRRLDLMMNAALERSKFLFDSGLQAEFIFTTATAGLAKEVVRARSGRNARNTGVVEKEGGAFDDKLFTLTAWLEGLSAGGAIARAGFVMPLAVAKGISLARMVGKAGVYGTTRSGAKVIMNRLRNRNVDKFKDAEEADLVSMTSTPKVEEDLPEAAVFLHEEFVPAAQKAAVEAEMKRDLGGLLAHNNKHTVDLEDVEGGVKGKLTFGTTKGKGYKTEEAARKWAEAGLPEGTKFNTFEKDGQWFVRTENTRMYGLRDIGDSSEDVLEPGANMWKYAGKAFGATASAERSSNIAIRQGENTIAGMRRIMTPLFELVPGSQRRVYKVLDEADLDEVEPTVDWLRDRGLTDPEIKGALSVRRAAEVQRQIADVNAVQKANAAGYRHMALRGGASVKGRLVEDVDAVIRSSGKKGKNIEALDEKGVVRSLEDVRDGERVVRLLQRRGDGIRFMIVAEESANTAKLLDSVIPRVAGYLPRPYRYPWFVKRIEKDGSVTTVQPAMTQKEAQAAIDARKADPDDAGEYDMFRANETHEDFADELEAMGDAGLLNDKSRGYARLKDATGKTRMYDVEHRVQQLITSAGNDAGIGRWQLVEIERWNQRHGHLFDSPMNALTDPSMLKVKKAGGNEVQKEIEQAINEAHFIQNTAGVGSKRRATVSQSVRNKVADFLYNLKLNAVANQVSGLSNSALDSMKTAAYVSYLTLNPTRMLPLQMSQVMSYAGVEGGLRYMTGYANDSIILMAAAAGGVQDVSKIAKAVKMDPKEAQELVDQFRRSGIDAANDQHVFGIGIIGHDVEGSTKMGMITDPVKKLHTAIRKSGIDAGIMAERTSAWLFARNRWKVQNPGKKIDAKAEREIAAFAETLSLNPNRADTLPIQKGALSVATQFLAMQVKQNVRHMAAFAPGATEAGLSRAERIRMATILMAGYGFRGAGLDKVANWVLSDKELDDMDPILRERLEILVRGGLSNLMFDEVMSAATGETVRSDISTSFSPIRLSGQFTVGAVDILKAIMSGDPNAMEGIRLQAPALGLAGSMIEFVTKEAAPLMGVKPIPRDGETNIEFEDRLIAGAKRFVERFPVGNNWMKAQAAIKFKAVVDDRGVPIAESNGGTVLMAILGVKSRDEMDLIAGNQWLYQNKSFGPKDGRKGIRDYAKEVATWAMPLFDQVNKGEMDEFEALKWFEDLNAFATLSLDDYHRAEFYSELGKIYLSRKNSNKTELFFRRLYDAVGKKNGIPITKDIKEQLRTAPLSPEQRKIIEDKIDILTGNPDA